MVKKRWTHREVIKAVHEDDLESFLSSIGILEDILSERYKCQKCNRQISLKNLGAVCPEEGTIRVICDLPSCLSDIAFDRETENG
jgi:hypothetical protein